jgi:HEAT repeat protein
MLNWLTNFQIEKISFFIGFFSALVFFIAFSRIRKLLPDLKKFLLGYLHNYKKLRLTNVRDVILNETFKRAQSNHLTKHLFSLDEILIEPDFLVQPDINLDENILFRSEIPSIVPFIPEYPTLSRNYNVPRLDLSEITQNRANIVICGEPGSGKTVALSHLVTKIIKNENDKFSTSITPFFLSIHDIDLDKSQNSVVSIIANALIPKISGVSSKQVQSFVKNEVDSENCLVIFDDLDELHPDKFDEFSDILKNILQENSNLQVITTCTPFYFGNLLKIGFSPIYISAWSTTQTQRFYEKWNSLWDKYIDIDLSNTSSLTSSIINAWSSSRTHPMTPLEYTLHIWGASSGDLSGYGIENLMMAYINRLIPDKDQQNKLKILANDCINRKTNVIKPNHKIEEIENFFELGLFSKVANNNFVFSHTTIMAFLASIFGEDPQIERTNNYFNWAVFPTYLGFQSSSEEKAIEYPSNSSDISSLVISIYNIGCLLKFSKPDSQLRTKLIKYLINQIFEKKNNFSIRLRSLAALIQANDPHLPVFIKQLISNNDPELIQFALYAIGSTNQDPSFIKEILPITKTPSLNLRKLAYLVLTTFDDELSIHELGKALLSEDENVRQIIAESFAFNNPKGEEILKEAVSLTDIVVRRSAIFGLIKLKNDWAKKTLKTLAIEDNQWVIRNAALQASEFLEKDNPLIPQNAPPLHQNPWLVKFAGENNLGVAPEKSVVYILKMALSTNDTKNISNATKLLIQDHNDEIIDDLKNKLNTINNQRVVDLILLTLFTINNSKNILGFNPSNN